MEKIPLPKKRQINSDELKKIRKFFHGKQGHICPILKIKFKTEEMVVDHQHSSNAKNLKREYEAGILRGVINRYANAWDGKVTNSYIRCGLHKSGVPLHEALRSLADFVEHPPLAYLNYLHPNEKPKSKILKKNLVKKVKKLFKEKYPNKKIPEVLIYKKKKTKRGKMKEKGKKLTAGLEKLFQEFGIEPEFKKGK